MSLTLAIVRKTRLVTDAQVKAACAALQIQISRDFAPLWGSDAKAIATTRPPAAAWPIFLVDHVDVPGALGYHDTSNHRANGTPLGYVGIADDAKYGLDWHVTLGHEALEMLGDPSCSAVMPYPGGRSVALECGDPVEADQLGYRINGLLQTNFVTPAWFDGRTTRYDFRGVLSKPLTLAKGGYISVFDGTSWSQMTKRAAPGVTSRVVLSRRHRGNA